MQPSVSSEQQPLAPAAPADLMSRLTASSGYIALFAAWVATCGSLFFSEVFGWPPCTLCWYQRIFMYPLALILAVGLLRRDANMHWYVLPLAVPGMLLALYHYMLIKTTIFPPAPCTMGVPCNIQLLYPSVIFGVPPVFDFINIPFLALVAFAVISVAMAVYAVYPPQPAAAYEDSEDGDDTPAPVAARWSSYIGVAVIVGGVVASFGILASRFLNGAA